MIAKEFKTLIGSLQKSQSRTEREFSLRPKNLTETKMTQVEAEEKEEVT